MAQPRPPLNTIVQYPAGTTFGDRFAHLPNAKSLVAREVVRRLLGPGMSLFLSDGNSTCYVGLAIFEAAGQDDLDYTIYTNNLPVAHEFPLWKQLHPPLNHVRVRVAGGDVGPDLFLIGGEAADGDVENFARAAQFTILSVRSLFFEQGPAGMEHVSLSIKQSALRGAGSVIFIADHEKLSFPYRNEPLVYPPGEWARATGNLHLYVVTSRYPGLTVQQLGDRAPIAPATPAEWYLYHSKHLRAKMGARFIELA